MPFFPLDEEGRACVVAIASAPCPEFEDDFAADLEVDATGLVELPDRAPSGLSAGVAPYLRTQRAPVGEFGKDALLPLGCRL